MYKDWSEKKQPACKEKPWKRTNAQDNFTEITGKSGSFLRKYKEIRSGSLYKAPYCIST